LGIIARPLSVVEHHSDDLLFAELTHVMAEYGVTHIVLGLPLKLDGTEGPAALEVRTFAEKLRGALSTPVELWDERLSTAQAERAMLDADMSRANRKQRRDKVAAQIFLQSYLDAHRSDFA
jgi:putative Holliday junction resolvase